MITLRCSLVALPLLRHLQFYQNLIYSLLHAHSQPFKYFSYSLIHFHFSLVQNFLIFRKTLILFLFNFHHLVLMEVINHIIHRYILSLLLVTKFIHLKCVCTFSELKLSSFLATDFDFSLEPAFQY
jgi:uncharacterized membrane protein